MAETLQSAQSDVLCGHVSLQWDQTHAPQWYLGSCYQKNIILVPLETKRSSRSITSLDTYRARFHTMAGEQ